MKTVQNETPALEDVQPVIDEQIVETVHGIFEAINELNPLDNILEDLADRIINDLAANSFMDVDLELKDDQKDVLRKNVKMLGHETARNYLANLDTDKRTKLAYGLVREKTTAIADTVLSAIGREINRGAVINAHAVQANSKNDKYDEILLRKTKTSGDITVPTSVIVISTNCVDVIKASCQEEKPGEATADKPTKPSKKKGKND